MTMMEGVVEPRLVADGRDADRVDAWARYFARMLDVLILSFVIIILLTIVGMMTAHAQTEALVEWMESGFLGSLLSNMLAIALALPAIALLLARGWTPGKWWLGVRVRDSDGNRLGLKRAFVRELMVWIQGMGLGLPLVSLITLILSYTTLTEDGTTRWDSKLGCRVTHAPRTAFWWLRAALGAVLVLAATLYGVFSMLLASVG